MSLNITGSLAHYIIRTGEKYTSGNDFSKGGVVSERVAQLNGGTADEPPKKAAELPLVPGIFESAADDDGRFRRIETLVIGGFWLLQWIYFSIDNYIRAPSFEGWSHVGARGIVSFCGALISFGILKLLRRCIGMSFVKRTLLALALAYGGAAIHTLVNWAVFTVISGPYEGGPFDTFVDGSFPLLVYLFSWVYLAITVLLLSLTYGEELVRRERRIAQLTGDADRARLSALRYQLNPHFLFNSLNSAASLVSAERNREAELMLENLADFLRATLTHDAEGEITLRDEIKLQSLYLDVERVRFPHRLRVEKHVPADLLDALVPNLITQPLVENSVKHALAQSYGRVTLKIAASDDAGRLRIEVGDSGGTGERPAAGAGIGLCNVANRLKLHFGDEASFDCGPTAGGGFRSTLVIPLRRRA
jgi:hypothetical protein